MPYTSLLKTVLPTSSAKFLLTLLLVQIAGAFFTVYVYGTMTSLGDSGLYMASDLPLSLDIMFRHRVNLPMAIFGKLGDVFSLLEVCLIGGVGFAILVYFQFRKIIHHVPTIYFWMVLTMPTFLVYTGLPSKEFLTILFFLPVVQQTAYFLINKKMNLPLVFLFLSLGFFMRPHYGIAYFFLVVVTLFSTKINLNNKIIVPIIIGLIGITSITILFNYFSVFDNGFWSAIQKIKMVYRNGDSFRPDVPWESTKDYFRHLWWGIPMSIIGPFPNEIIERPKLLIPFVFGLISLAMIFILGFKTYRLVKVNKTLAFVIKYGFGIGVFIILLIHFPFGIFNPGAGFRFKQNLAPFLYFYPLFVIGYYNKKKSESNSTD